MDASELLQQPHGGFRPVLLLQAHAQNPVLDQRQEAHQRMGADAPRQAVVDRPDLNVALERAEASLDVGQALVARSSLGNEGPLLAALRSTDVPPKPRVAYRAASISSMSFLSSSLTSCPTSTPRALARAER